VSAVVPTVPRTKSKLAEARTFRLTLAKRKSLELLAEYFCLRTKDVAALLRGREPSESDLHGTRRTLGLLHQAKLVNRLPYFELDRSAGGIGYVYGLSDKGIPDADCYPYPKSFDEHSARTLDHELEISFFHIAVWRFAEGNGLRLYWQQSDLKRGIHPDALFALTDPRKPEERNTYYFFLEIERSRVGNFRNGEPGILRKLARYADYFGSDACQRDWNFRRFRVIVVQRTEARRDHLLWALREKYGRRMFWLTTERLYKENIAGEIFRSPDDSGVRNSLLSL
jgi:Replication-relaxation